MTIRITVIMITFIEITRIQSRILVSNYTSYKTESYLKGRDVFFLILNI